MKYGTIPRGFKERFAAALGLVPHPMLDVLIAPLQARALIAAQRAGVFERLARSPMDAVALAADLKLDASCLDLVLRVLASMGYVRARAGVWSLSKLGRKHFGPDAGNPFGDFVAFGAPQWNWISQLDEVLRSGRGVDMHATLAGGDWTLYQRAMAEGARDFEEFIARELPVAKGATLCLDVAGSHGRVGAALCRAHPGLRSVVLEKPEAMDEAKKLAAASGAAETISFRECDILADEYGRDADVVVLANILHHFSPQTNRDILARAKKALKAGGTIGIFDIEAPRPDAPPEAAGDGAALFFRITSSGACYAGDDYERWLTEAGFSAARIVRSVRLPARLLATARVG